MCGIAGILTAEGTAPPAFAELEQMISMLGHRAPDGHGLYRDDRVGLAHGRLSLIDLATGAQPVSYADQSIWVVLNGEIFNYIELRQDLRALGHKFRTNSDTEVLAACYAEYGERAWAMLNGQFAIALWDRRTRKFYLVRDRVGISPLHFARTDGGVVFASEPKALFSGGRVAPQFDAVGLAKAFAFWSPPAPHTVFQGIAQVEPATALCFDTRLNFTKTRYWTPNLTVKPMSDDEAADGVAHHLSQAVKLRLRADTPVGAYLSGGLDSSLIGVFAKDALGAGALDTFSIGFDDARFDERDAQHAVGNLISSRRHEIVCGSRDIVDALQDVVWHCETPLLRTSPAPMFLLSDLVRRTGIKTVLTGEGADEYFAGYTIFKEDQIRRFWARQPNSKIRSALLSRIHHYIGGDEARSTELWRGFFANGLSETEHPFYAHLIRWRNTSWTWRLLAPDIANAASLEALMADTAASMPDRWRDADPLSRAQLTEIETFMSSYLLSSQGDRVTMGHGVEGRFPFLDPDLIDFSFTLPKRQKLDGLHDKVVLRRLAQRRLPESVWRRKKQPFRAPIAGALFSPEGRAHYRDYLTPAALAEHGLCNAAVVAQLLRRVDEGKPLGEREEMGLVGVLTLTILARHLGAGFAGHVERGRSWLQGSARNVYVDQSSSGAGAPERAEGAVLS
ncbi:MAG: asparagine synthase (glutamine-hydrolyzing) [Hyphomonadaceae bacterium]|nr:asparagine synthase (glutamine-hydrolyzing) [Hyphomonadaceae bacterium]